MVEIDPVLQMGAMAVAGMMDRREEVTPEKNSELAGINLVVSISFRIRLALHAAAYSKDAWFFISSLKTLGSSISVFQIMSLA